MTSAREAAHSRRLAEQGHLERLWMLPSQSGDQRALGLWCAADAGAMRRSSESLPLLAWISVEMTPLTVHPSDPAAA
ncbi:muconolactone Delta-isomerase family protein [Mycobacterium sp. E342]|uniref:muconolactone Delta-isomerase family protein n=1 Tax=Mycobacterium sp. E342 TaxID=1834147 RepID=UPI0012EAA095|nr:muconolactone Delta-isomerase family protein [Mycobacterium sp. E342]